jgi:transcription elongation GreA/GreB family factor
MPSTETARAPIVLTSAGREWLRARLERTEQRLAGVERDLAAESSSELFAEQRSLTEQVEELTRLLRDAVAPGDISDDPNIVELGDRVEVEFPDGERESFLVVHPVEAGMDEHRTSADAPIARAVIGRRPGDQVTVAAPAGVYSATIISRERID